MQFKYISTDGNEYNTVSSDMSSSSNLKSETSEYRWNSYYYVVRQLSSRTRHHVFSVTALDKSLSMVWWRSHISVSQLCCCC